MHNVNKNHSHQEAEGWFLPNQGAICFVTILPSLAWAWRGSAQCSRFTQNTQVTLVLCHSVLCDAVCDVGPDKISLTQDHPSNLNCQENKDK